MTSQNLNVKKALKIAMLISGEGTTMESILKACKDGKLPNIAPVLIISSKANAGGIARAKSFGFAEKDIIVIDPKSFTNREEFGEAILKECRIRGVEFIGQYGWLFKTPDNVIDAFPNMVVNQHNGPLDTGRPDFGGPGMYGLRVNQARIEFVRRTGHDFWTEATSHLVTSEFDKGAILRRKRVDILPNDTAESLQTSMRPAEHEVQIETLHDFSEGHVTTFVREKSLVEKSEEGILEECKEIAKKAYPNG